MSETGTHQFNEESQETADPAVTPVETPEPEAAIRVAIVQTPSVFLDPMAGVEKARRLIQQAVNRGAKLVAFGECWLPGYPIHAAMSQDSPGWWDLATQYLARAIEIPGPESMQLCQLAQQYEIDIVMGVAERDEITRGSVYSTMLFIGNQGNVVGRHRKLRPHVNERAVFADGDGSGLQAHDREYAIVSTLAGWEHQMMLPGYSLAEQGTQIHVGCWAGGETVPAPAPAAMHSRQHLLSRAFAAQTGAYVLCAAGCMSAEDVPERYRHMAPAHLSGDSVIIDPRGEIIAGPVQGEAILYADCSMTAIRAAKIAFDCAGHSSRRDQLEMRNHALQNDDETGEQDRDFGGDQDGFDMNGHEMGGDDPQGGWHDEWQNHPEANPAGRSRGPRARR